MFILYHHIHLTSFHHICTSCGWPVTARFWSQNIVIAASLCNFPSRNPCAMDGRKRKARRIPRPIFVAIGNHSYEVPSLECTCWCLTETWDLWNRAFMFLRQKHADIPHQHGDTSSLILKSIAHQLLTLGLISLIGRSVVETMVKPLVLLPWLSKNSTRYVQTL